MHINKVNFFYVKNFGPEKFHQYRNIFHKSSKSYIYSEKLRILLPILNILN